MRISYKLVTWSLTSRVVLNFMHGDFNKGYEVSCYNSRLCNLGQFSEKVAFHKLGMTWKLFYDLSI